MRRKNFYYKIIKKYLENKIDNTILILGAGSLDKEVLEKYSNVFFTNVNKQNEVKMKSDIFMQDLPYNDNSYDYVITHAAVHHCSKPHAAILEMIRVAKFGVIFYRVSRLFFNQTLLFARFFRNI